MRNIFGPFCSSFLLLLCLVNYTANANYELVVTTDSDNGVYSFNVDGDGHIHLPPRAFDISADVPGYIGTVSMYVSNTGKYLFLTQWDRTNSAIFSVDKNLEYHFVQETNQDCTGVGFTLDDEYLITCTDYLKNLNDMKLRIREWNGSKFDVIASQPVAATVTLTAPQLFTAKDDVFAPSAYGNAASYHFNRISGNLTFLQHLTVDEAGINLCDMSKDGSMVVFYGSHFDKEGIPVKNFGSLVRDTSGQWHVKSRFWNSLWRNSSGTGIFITPDSKYAVGLIDANDDTRGGVVLMTISPDGDLTEISKHPFMGAQRMAMTPDGKYFAVAHNFANELSVLRFDSKNGIFTEVHRIQGAHIFRMQFLPQAFPPAAANDACTLYGDTRSARPAAPADHVAKKEISPQNQSTTSSNAHADGGIEWKRVEIERKK